MALSIRPADALIHRLLQQNSKVNDVRESPEKVKIPTDRVTISADARPPEKNSDLKQSYGPSGSATAQKQADLEARLLRMYSGSSDVDK